MTAFATQEEECSFPGSIPTKIQTNMVQTTHGGVERA